MIKIFSNALLLYLYMAAYNIYRQILATRFMLEWSPIFKDQNLVILF